MLYGFVWGLWQDLRMRIPVTGTVTAVSPYVSGDLDDPIRLIDIHLENVSWTLIKLDLDNELMEIEVTPSEKVSEDTGEIDEEGNPIFRSRAATLEEKQQFIEYAKNHSLGRKTKDELYALSKSPRLKNPFKVASVE